MAKASSNTACKANAALVQDGAGAQMPLEHMALEVEVQTIAHMAHVITPVS